MGKRIFTKPFTGIQIVAGPTEVEVPASQSWLAQEDIEVVGVSGWALNTVPDENDGFAYLIVELSQTGDLDQPGSILKLCAQEGWNTVPQGIHTANAHNAVVFPAGFTIPVKEEGHLYINMKYENKSAGISTFQFGFIVYYTKRGGR